MNYRYNKLLELGMVMTPTIAVWWLFQAGYSWVARLGTAAWAVGWVWSYQRYIEPMIPLRWVGISKSAILMLSVASGMWFLIYYLFRSGKAAVRQEVAEHLASESNEFFVQIQEVGVLPVYQDDSINLRRGEFIVYREEGPILEYRVSGISFSEGKAYRGWNGSFTRSRSQKDLTERLTETGFGTLYITNERVIVLGDKFTLSKQLNQVLNMSAQGKRVLLSFEGRNKPVAVLVPNPYIPIGFQRYLNNTYVRTPEIGRSENV